MDIADLKTQLIATYHQLREQEVANEQPLKAQLTEVSKQLQTLKERWALGKISEEVFEEFAPQYKKQIEDIQKELANTSHDSSNLDEYLQIALEGAANMVEVWKLFDYSEKQRLQYLVFPNGVKYDRKTDTVRTDKVNSIFRRIARLTGNLGHKKTGQTNTQIDLSGQVGTTRFELATPCTPCKCATGLRYVPNFLPARLFPFERLGLQM